MQNWKATKGKAYFTSPVFEKSCLTLFATDFRRMFSLTLNESEIKEQIYIQLPRFSETPVSVLLKNLEAALIDPKEEEIKCENDTLNIKITSKGKIPLIFQYVLKELNTKQCGEIIYQTVTLPLIALCHEQDNKLRFMENIVTNQSERLLTCQTMLQLREVTIIPPQKDIPKLEDYKPEFEIEVDGNMLSEIVIKSQPFKIKQKAEPMLVKSEKPVKRELDVVLKEDNIVDDIEQNIINARNKQAQKKKKFGM